MLARLLVCVGLAGGLAAAQDEKARQEYVTRAAAARRELAAAFVEVGKWAADRKAHDLAYPCWEKAIGFDPDNATARQKLGYRKQGGDWIADPNAKTPREYEGPTERHDPIQTEVLNRLDACRKKGADKLYAVGKWAKERGLVAEAERCFQEAIALHGEHEGARKALGFRREGGAWVSAKDSAAREAAAQRVAAAEEGEDWTDPTEVEEAVGATLQKRKSAHFRIWAYYGGDDLKRTVKMAEAARAEFHALFDVPEDPPLVAVPIEHIVVNDLAQHEAIIDKLTDWDEPKKASFKKFKGFCNYAPPRSEMLCTKDDRAGAVDHVVHDTVHILWNAFGGTTRVKEIPWLKEGLAFYVSGRLLQTASTHCIAQESGVLGGSSVGKPGGWRYLLRLGLEDGSDPDLRALMNTQMNSMNGPMGVKAWSLVEWSFAEKRNELSAFIRHVREGATQEEALRQAFGGGYDHVQAGWAAWVRATY